MHRVLQPDGWPRPSGYANGIAAEGRMVFVAGQVGWDETGTFRSERFVDQVDQALGNTLAILAEAGAGPAHVVRMTWFITDKRVYLSSLKALGPVWRDRMGKSFPAMSVVEVSGLIEDGAKVEIETTAVMP